MTKLSEPKRHALGVIAAAGVYRQIGAGTLGALEKSGLIERVEGGYRATAAGEEAVASARD